MKVSPMIVIEEKGKPPLNTVREFAPSHGWNYFIN